MKSVYVFDSSSIRVIGNYYPDHFPSFWVQFEQAVDATAIDIRADIFGLGATLFFALVGQTPFPLEGSVHEMLLLRL